MAGHGGEDATLWVFELSCRRELGGGTAPGPKAPGAGGGPVMNSAGPYPPGPEPLPGMAPRLGPAVGPGSDRWNVPADGPANGPGWRLAPEPGSGAGR